MRNVGGDVRNHLARVGNIAENDVVEPERERDLFVEIAAVARRLDEHIRKRALEVVRSRRVRRTRDARSNEQRRSKRQKWPLHFSSLVGPQNQRSSPTSREGTRMRPQVGDQASSFK
jgi:hypothetical protein